jgi:hypothetical protein
LDDVGRTSRALAPEAWESSRWIWHPAFYGLLLTATVSALVGGGLDGNRRLALVGLALVLVVWYLLLAVPYPLGGARLVPSAIFLAGFIGLWYALVSLHPAFYLLLFIAYPLIFSRLRLSLTRSPWRCC